VASGCAAPARHEAAAPEAPAPPAAVAPRLPALNLDDIYFESGKADLRAEAKAVLRVEVDRLLAAPDEKIEIAGHCDERGTDAYNLDLGWKRAYAVRDYLVRQGIAETRLFPISYGRSRPAVAGSGEAAWEKNRRSALSPR